MICDHKHTKFQPTEEQFCCPKCGAKCGIFYVEESPNGDCEKLHTEDSIACMECGYSASGAVVARTLANRLDLVECPCCKGAGMVPKEKP